MAATWYQELLSTIIYYETAKIVRIRNSKVVGLINRLVQLTIFCYILVWVLIIQKGYQLKERGLSAVSTRVHGVAYTRELPLTHNIIQERLVWDSVDTAVPAEENKAFFVTTSATVTSNQTQSVCAEDSTQSSCGSDEECQPADTPILQGDGVTNGTCNNETGTCFIKAWCPLANDNKTLLKGVDNFTVLIKSHVLFSEYKTRASNVANLDSDYVNNCRYHPTTDPQCPVFKLGDMVAEALAGTSYNFEDLISDGAVIAIRVDWVCDLDYDVKGCFPTYKFVWLDNRERDDFSTGYNYESAHYYEYDGVAHREHITRYGILFIMITNAEAGKFEIFSTALHVGAGLALLGASTFLCDFIILYCLKNKHFYKKSKYEGLKGQDESLQFSNLNLNDPIGLYDELL